MITAVQISKAKSRMVLPKYGMSFEEVCFAVGSEDLAKRMKKSGWIEARYKNLFDSGDVAKAWARILKGEEP